jgi:hypothetical protein
MIRKRRAPTGTRVAEHHTEHDADAQSRSTARRPTQARTRVLSERFL